MSEKFPLTIVGVPMQPPFPSGVAVMVNKLEKPVVMDWDDFQLILEGMVARARLNAALREDEEMRETCRTPLETRKKALGLAPHEPFDHYIIDRTKEGGR